MGEVMGEKIRWGILGCGKIANKLAEAVTAVENAELAAVGSRTREKAEAFADEHGAANRHGSYESLVADPIVDVVYVATPHPMHRENSILALEADKPVLCEKPFTVTTAEAVEVVETAERKGLFLMEAMWTRFLPPVRRIRELLEDGAVGEVRMVQADFGFRSGWDPAGRLLNPDLAGGGLLDVGVYTLSLASMILPFPLLDTVSLADIGRTGVDEQCAVIIKFEGGRLAVLISAIRTRTPQGAVILGTEGWIDLGQKWWGGGPFVLHRDGSDPETVEVPMKENGFIYEVEETGRCLKEGIRESPVLPWQETLRVMEMLDTVRSCWQQGIVEEE